MKFLCGGVGDRSARGNKFILVKGVAWGEGMGDDAPNPRIKAFLSCYAELTVCKMENIIFLFKLASVLKYRRIYSNKLLSVLYIYDVGSKTSVVDPINFFSNPDQRIRF